MAGLVEFRGMRDFRRELRQVEAKLPREVGRALRSAVREIVLPEAQAKARAMGGVQAHAAGGIQAFGTQTRAGLRFSTSKKYAMAAGAFFGSKRFRQFPAWVGNRYEMPWPAGINDQGPGRGPYAINPALASKADEFHERVGDALEELAARAFPLPY